ncbi:sigma-70 family RNA polymerase sigma factor [Streptococcus suis]|uniref:sigma-70 family RNA polymerase sigma factor n=1 Tax=Streptococcus suis TaxID=1307 RepID=UPI0019164158|nr:sigma-70 family RNA polymerase sigma factor [Streptococcus suis]MBL1156411.1 sigma-70 family RNA polymerase sigma factor [Streptococcus suis]MBL3696338.1 sigma-70 family RNA polymerase sigma factor [Streptococcus suis]MBM6380784.1 sigma-70 family RNA polymerase sigma factor [Streptococcus suis]MBM6390592.1 sigma-70 family RNA polymerase sigma factor [Streptococcus suis]MBM6392587.1 sigma-70 family RNA polymerase sigma factor [Streptococcus suis]
MFEINMTINERLRDIRDLKDAISSLENDKLELEKTYPVQSRRIRKKKARLLVAIRGIKVKRQRMTDLINQLSDENQRKILTLQYIEGVKDKHLVEASGLKDYREVSSIRQKAIKNLEQLQKQLEQPQA